MRLVGFGFALHWEPLIPRALYHIRQLLKIRAPLAKILHVAGISIHDVVNSQDAKDFVAWEWKCSRHIDKTRRKESLVPDQKREEYFDCLSKGVLPPWSGGPVGLMAWLKGGDSDRRVRFL
jgi:hypothetical protein